MTRKRFLSVLFGILLVGSTFGLQFLPEHILFRQRLLFSLLTLDEDRPLKPFDHVTHDGLTLRSWYAAADPGMPVIVYFPGRDGNILFKPWHLYELAQSGYGLLMVGYRGYGGNPGWPNEFAMHLDAVGLVSQAAEAGMTPSGYVLYGYSMGTGLATNAAAGLAPLAVILEAPISRFLDAVRQQARFVPSWLVRTRFDNVERVSELTVPVLLLAGAEDEITPVWFAQSLVEANPTKARLKVVEGANHFRIMRKGGERLVRDFLLGLSEPASTEDAVTQSFAPVRMPVDPSAQSVELD